MIKIAPEVLSLSYIIIRTEPNVQGIELGDKTITTDDQITLYAAGYNTNDTFLVDVPVVWESTSILDPVNGTGTSFTFSPVTPLTSGTIIASSGFITDASRLPYN